MRLIRDIIRRIWCRLNRRVYQAWLWDGFIIHRVGDGIERGGREYRYIRFNRSYRVGDIIVQEVGECH